MPKTSRKSLRIKARKPAPRRPRPSRVASPAAVESAVDERLTALKSDFERISQAVSRLVARDEHDEVRVTHAAANCNGETVDAAPPPLHVRLLDIESSSRALWQRIAFAFDRLDRIERCIGLETPAMPPVEVPPSTPLLG